MSITSVVLYFALVYVISSLPGLSGKETSRRGVILPPASSLLNTCRLPERGGGVLNGRGLPWKVWGFCYQRQQYFIVWNPSLFRSALVQHWYLLFLWFASRTLLSLFPGLHTSLNSFLYYSISHFFCGEIGPLQMRLALMLLALQWPLAFTSLRVKEKRCEQERSKGSRRIIFVASFSF